MRCRNLHTAFNNLKHFGSAEWDGDSAEWDGDSDERDGDSDERDGDSDDMFLRSTNVHFCGR